MPRRRGREMGPGLAVPAGESGHGNGVALGDEFGSAMQMGGNHVFPGTSLGKGMSYLSLHQWYLGFHQHGDPNEAHLGLRPAQGSSE